MALEGRWLWTLKDWIDRTWMHGYQDGLPKMSSEGADGAPSAVALAVRGVWGSNADQICPCAV